VSQQVPYECTIDHELVYAAA